MPNQENTKNKKKLTCLHLDCVVYDDRNIYEYPIISNQCLDPFVQVTRSDVSDSSNIKISYKAFQFRGISKKVSTQKIICTVRVKLTFFIIHDVHKSIGSNLSC